MSVELKIEENNKGGFHIRYITTNTNDILNIIKFYLSELYGIKDLIWLNLIESNFYLIIF